MGYHKYCDPARIDIIENGCIRFTPANGFNDPFECLPDSRLIEHPAWQQQIEDASVHDLLFEEAMLSVVERRPPRWTEAEIRRIHRERYPLRLAQIKEVAKKAIQVARDPFRILCLSQVDPDSPEALLLWGHYTANHRGFVITFNPDDPWFAEHQPQQGKPCDCGPVIYSDQRPGWIVEDNGHVEPRRDFIFTKSSHWAYEKEFRLVRFRNTPGVNSAPVDALVAFPPSALREITLGENLLDDVKNRIVAAVARPGFTHIRVFQAKIDPDNYRLNVAAVPLPYAP